MKKPSIEGALACVGAVIGAGFVSGREVISFFTRYGWHSWWLIVLSATTMLWLCTLCMRRAAPGCVTNWCELYQRRHRWMRTASQLCASLLLVIIGGAMISASGHMIMLLWPSDWAYAVGAVGTLFLAWLLGFSGMKPLSLISSLLTLFFFAGILLLLKTDQAVPMVATAEAVTPMELMWAAVRAVAYAAMNIAISIGVVCKVCCTCRRKNDRQSVLFGLLLIFLLFISNYLYMKHPELGGEAFPVVRLFADFGRTGFVLSVLLLYLAIFTTLIAVIYALRGAVGAHVQSGTLACVITLGCPLAVSAVGFMGIVDGLYAPIGLMCLLVVFLPLIVQRGKKDANVQEKAEST